ncbi:phosphatase PAP2 family protein [Dactylosporangium sp. CA-152071]|uniref:phosphatase PAP2 family protein n=1 Tax=Dactylosporangium sp. CA-152071 TaxID=3239933 RepID=UPI003D9010E1
MTITWEKPALRPVGLGRQVGIVTAAVAAYFGVRGATEAATDQALANAAKVVDFEKSVGLFHESWLQSTLAGSPAVATFFNWIYIYGHWPVIVATLIWLARTNPAIYYRTRNAMLLSGGIGLVVFMLFPLAPPRLAELGLVDTVTQSDGAYRVLQPTMFTNQYAAMPSLHVGWDLLIGLAILAAARGSATRPLLRAFGAAMPVLMVAAVVLTANHYIVDAIAGAALTTTCWLVLRARERRSPRGYAGWDGLALR